MKKVTWIASTLVLIVGIFGCQEISGDCWPVSEDGQGDGAGGGPLIPGSGGGFGNVPPEPQDDTEKPPPGCNIEEDTEEKPKPKPKKGNDDSSCSTPVAAGVPATDGTTFAYCSGACTTKCPTGGVSGFSPSVFKFTTIVADDGKDEGGGWQAASVALRFFRWTGLLPESWSCSVTVGMPLRTKLYGNISPTYAANISAGVASEATMTLMHIKPDLPPGIFCSKVGPSMQLLFDAKYPNMGTTVK